MPKDLVDDALKYPLNLKFSHYIRFFWAPTLCYQLSYPTAPSFRFGFFLKRLVEVVICQYLMLYIIF